MIIAAVFGGLAVALGALGAHALKNSLSLEQLQTFETAVKYQMYHAIVILVIAAFYNYAPSKLLMYAANLFSIGILFFSGSLYLLSLKNVIGLTNTSIIGPITPLGGLFLIAGWIVMLFAFIRK